MVTKSEENICSVIDLVTEMREWFLLLERSVSGYNSLHLSFLSHQGDIVEGVRKKGLPIFSFKAPSPNGRDAIEIQADLKKVDPKYVGHVLVPLINAQAADMLEAVGALNDRLEVLRNLLIVLLGIDKPPTQEETS